MPAKQIAVAAGNESQAEMWDGDEGQQWAADPEFFDRCIARHHARLLDAAQIGNTARVLDVGCGNGLTTRDAARMAIGGQALGVDLSSQMIERARLLAEADGLINASFLQADVQIHDFDIGSFDVAISRFGTMFFSDQTAAFANIARALTPGGRLVFTSWRELDRNEWVAEVASALTLGRPLPFPSADVPGPFCHASADHVEQILRDGGFVDIEVVGIEEPMDYGRTADEAFGKLLELWGWISYDLDDTDRSRASDALRASVESHASADGVLYGTSAWLVSARRA